MAEEFQKFQPTTCCLNFMHLSHSQHLSFESPPLERLISSYYCSWSVMFSPLSCFYVNTIQSFFHYNPTNIKGHFLNAQYLCFLIKSQNLVQISIFMLTFLKKKYKEDKTPSLLSCVKDRRAVVFINMQVSTYFWRQRH